MVSRRELMIAGATAVAATACAPSPTPTATHSPQTRKALLSGFALNTESWFTDLPFQNRFDAAARADFSHVEFWFLNEEDRAADKLAKVAKDAGVSVAQIVGDCPALAKPDSRAQFLEDCQRAIERAKILDTDIITFVGHQTVEGLSKADSLKAYQDHMAAAAPLFEEAKVFAAIEPFNPYDHPGFFIYGSQDAVEIVRAVNSPFVKLNWDLFHMQRAEGELIGNLRKGSDAICYVQLADAPDRNQPGTGDVNYVNVIREVRALGYDRPIGLEFWAKDGDYEKAVSDMIDLGKRLQANIG